MTNIGHHSPLLELIHLEVSIRNRVILREINLQIPPGASVALLGPSGIGKSTLLRCLNRLVDLTPSLRVRGEILFRGSSIRQAGYDVDTLRSRIGMLFQQPVVFPTSVQKNVLFGVHHQRTIPRAEQTSLVEQVLREACLWDEVKDRLSESALTLSVGQQQRLCLARALAMNPEVLLLDEPTSALDSRATAIVEESLLRLKGHRTLVLVTHNEQQAIRLAELATRLARTDHPDMPGGATLSPLMPINGI